MGADAGQAGSCRVARERWPSFQAGGPDRKAPWRPCVLNHVRRNPALPPRSHGALVARLRHGRGAAKAGPPHRRQDRKRACAGRGDQAPQLVADPALRGLALGLRRKGLGDAAGGVPSNPSCAAASRPGRGGRADSRRSPLAARRLPRVRRCFPRPKPSQGSRRLSARRRRTGLSTAGSGPASSIAASSALCAARNRGKGPGARAGATSLPALRQCRDGHAAGTSAGPSRQHHRRGRHPPRRPNSPARTAALRRPLASRPC